MQIKLFRFGKMVNSTKKPNEGSGEALTPSLTISNAIINDANSTILNPEVRITISDANVASTLKYNYMYINNFERYYYINDWGYNGDGTWSAYCSEDLLASWKTAILNSGGYIGRADGINPTYKIADALYPSSLDFKVATATQGTGLTSVISSGTIVLGVVSSNDPNVGAAAYYTVTPANLNILVRALVGTNTSIFGDLQNLDKDVVKSLVNPMQFVVSCKWFPFNLVASGSSEQLKLGAWKAEYTEGSTTYKAYGTRMTSADIARSIVYRPSGTGDRNPNYSRITIPAPAAVTDEYPTYAPYARYSLISAWGTFDLDPNIMNMLYNSDYPYLYYKIYVNTISGTASLIVVAEPVQNGGFMPITELFRQEIMIGLDIPLSQTSFNYVNFAKSAISATAGAANMGFGIYAKDAKTAMEGGISLLNGVIDGAASAYSPSSQTVGSAAAAFTDLITAVEIQVVRYKVFSKSLSIYGQPIKKGINHLSSESNLRYVQMDKSLFDGDNGQSSTSNRCCLNDEKTEIIKYLESGIYIE